ncbi:sigma-54 dependent transcriptional regulator [Desulfothermus okinawensis JCM 13304]
MSSPHILVVDDEKNYLILLDALLSEEGYEVTVMQDPEMALMYLKESEVDVVITDFKMPGINGQELLERVREIHPHLPVIIMTAYGSVDGAVEAMKCGAFDYINKPFSNDDLLLSVSKAVKMSDAYRKNRLLLESIEENHCIKKIIGVSSAIKELHILIKKVAATNANVLITGESGTGKELVARAIHYCSSRKNEPFIAINCTALNPGVLESELFGHEKGSFTGAIAQKRGKFELANGGTIFLDEIGEFPIELQPKLLRVIQEHAFERVGGIKTLKSDFRVIAATNKDLKKEVEEGRFREDLYYRLNVVNIQIPPLRERTEDIPLLAIHFLKKYSEENKKQIKGFTPDAMQLLTAYNWPGNVRQLENIIESTVVLTQSHEISAEDLPAELKDESRQFKSAVDMLPDNINLSESLEKIEAALIKRALVKSNFIQVKAAKMLGISKSLLQYKMKKYNISVKP